MIPFLRLAGSNKRHSRAGLVLRMRAMVYSSKDFNLVDFCRDSAKYASIMAFAAPKVESLWFLRPAGSKRAELERLTKAEGLPK